MKEAGRNHGLEHWVHWTLSAGVAASGVLLFIGLSLTFLGGQPRPEGFPTGVGGMFAAAVTGNGPAIIGLGLLLLIATPLLRVAVLAVGWLVAGDLRFAAVASVVLGLLVLSLILGVG